MTETLQRRGTLYGHNGWVTQIATNPKYPDMILSSSRGKYNLILSLKSKMLKFWLKEPGSVKEMLNSLKFDVYQHVKDQDVHL